MLLTALVMAGLVAWVWLAHRQPSFEGRTLGEWCDLGIDSFGGDNESSALLASNAVWQIGEKAVPWLVRWGTVRQSKWESWLDETSGTKFEALGKWIETRDEARDRDRDRAGFLVETLRGRVAEAIPQLVKAASANDPDASSAALGLIQEIGPGGLPGLALALTNSFPDYWLISRQVLDSWGPDAERAGLWIWPRLDPNDDSLFQEELLRTLAAIQHRPADTAAVISARLKRFSGDEERCLTLYTALLEVGPDGASEFAAGLTTTNLVQREAAIRTLIYHVDQWGMPKLLGLILSSAGSEGKTNCLSYVKDIQHETKGKNWIYDPQRGHPLSLLCALADDADPAVATTAKGLISEYGGPLDATLKVYRIRRNIRF